MKRRATHSPESRRALACNYRSFVGWAVRPGPHGRWGGHVHGLSVRNARLPARPPCRQTSQRRQPPLPGAGPRRGHRDPGPAPLAGERPHKPRRPRGSLLSGRAPGRAVTRPTPLPAEPRGWRRVWGERRGLPDGEASAEGRSGVFAGRAAGEEGHAGRPRPPPAAPGFPLCRSRRRRAQAGRARRDGAATSAHGTPALGPRVPAGPAAGARPAGGTPRRRPKPSPAGLPRRHGAASSVPDPRADGPASPASSPAFRPSTSRIGSPRAARPPPRRPDPPPLPLPPPGPPRPAEPHVPPSASLARAPDRHRPNLTHTGSCVSPASGLRS